MRRHVMSRTLQRPDAPGPLELRRMRRGVLRMGRVVGIDTRAVVRFSGVTTGRRWRRCSGVDLEQVIGELTEIARRRVIQLQSNGMPKWSRNMRDWER